MAFMNIGMNIEMAVTLLLVMLGVVCFVVFTQASNWFQTGSTGPIRVYPALLFPPDAVVHSLSTEFKRQLYATC